MPPPPTGCGAGRLLEYLLRNCAFTPIHTLVGVDCSAASVSTAARRINALVESDPVMQVLPPPLAPGTMLPAGLASAGLGEGGAAAAAAAAAGGMSAGVGGVEASGAQGAPLYQVSEAAAAAGRQVLESQLSVASELSSAGGGTQPPSAGEASIWRVGVSLLHGDIAGMPCTLPEAWGALHGCELAALIEVVEHLPPEGVALLPACLLGGLRPRCLVVTTPNWEYNKVELVGSARGAFVYQHYVDE